MPSKTSLLRAVPEAEVATLVIVNSHIRNTTPGNLCKGAPLFFHVYCAQDNQAASSLGGDNSEPISNNQSLVIGAVRRAIRSVH